MKKTLIALTLALLFFAACKKDHSTSPKTTNSNFVLDSLIRTGDSLTLTWTRLGADSISGYEVLENADTTNTATPYSSNLFIADKNTNTYRVAIPYVPYVQFQVVALLNDGKSISSNMRTIVPTNTLFINTTFTDALYNPDAHLLFLYSRFAKYISVYDVQANSSVLSIPLPDEIGFCDIGTFNGTKELYVPCMDGWVYIYNATTLALIDKIVFNGGTSYPNVAYSNGKIFLNIGHLCTYDRATKNLLSTDTLNLSIARLKSIPGSTTEIFIEAPYTVGYVRANNGGVFDSLHTAANKTDINLDVFEVMPDGNHFFASYDGTMYDKSLTSSLPFGNVTLLSCAFDINNNVMYVGGPGGIAEYSMSDYHHIKTIATHGVPWKMFYDNGSIICVCTTGLQYDYAHPTEGYSGYGSTFIERY